jgi:hypothetical protein
LLANGFIPAILYNSFEQLAQIDFLAIHSWNPEVFAIQLHLLESYDLGGELLTLLLLVRSVLEVETGRHEELRSLRCRCRLWLLSAELNLLHGLFLYVCLQAIDFLKVFHALFQLRDQPQVAEVVFKLLKEDLILFSDLKSQVCVLLGQPDFSRDFEPEVAPKLANLNIPAHQHDFPEEEP